MGVHSVIDSAARLCADRILKTRCGATPGTCLGPSTLRVALVHE